MVNRFHRILVVDDNYYNLFVLEAMIRDHLPADKFMLLKAGNGREAYETFREHFVTAGLSTCPNGF